MSDLGQGVDGGFAGRRVVTTTGGRGGYAEGIAVGASLPIDVPRGDEACATGGKTLLVTATP